MNNNIQILGKY